MTELTSKALEKVNGGMIFVTDTAMYVTTDDYKEQILLTYNYSKNDMDMMEKALMVAKKGAAAYGVSTNIDFGQPSNYR